MKLGKALATGVAEERQRETTHDQEHEGDARPARLHPEPERPAATTVATRDAEAPVAG
ncbi:hypothetical protein ACWCP6_16300 [Streptomyces sp. NPDC002004]